MSLTQKAGRAAFWQILGGAWQTIVRLVASVFLARALNPSDFGLFGMAILIYGLLNHIGAFGMSSGIIVKQKVSRDDLNTCFWSITLVRSLLFLIVFLSAPQLAHFFKEPRLVPVIRVISFCFLIQIFNLIPEALLIKDLKFKSLNLIRGFAVFLESFFAVFFALTTQLAYWSLVLGMLINVVFYNICLILLAKWFPSLKFNVSNFMYFFRFGIHGIGFAITNYLRQNLDYLLVGRLLGSYQLGLYEFAYRIPHLVFERISRPVGRVVFPVLAKIQYDNERIFFGYVKAVKFVALVTFPILFGMIAVADILVPVLWGNQWLSIVRPLQILSLCAALRCLFQPIGSIFYCKNRPDIPFKVSIAILIFTAICIWFLGYHFGLIGVAIGMLFSVFPSFFVLWFAFRFMLGVSIVRMFRELFPVFFSSLLCSIVAYLVRELFVRFYGDIKLALVVSILFGGLVYVFSLLFFFPFLVKEVFRDVELIFGKSFRVV